MKVPYQRYEVDSSAFLPDGILFRPEVLLRVSGPAGDAFLMSALVDTGAAHTVLPYHVAEIVGATPDEKRAEPVAGFTGDELIIMPATVGLQIIHGKQSFSWSAVVGFVKYPHGDDEAILGHTTCLDFFRIRFDGDLHQLELIPTTVFPGTVSDP